MTIAGIMETAFGVWLALLGLCVALTGAALWLVTWKDKP